MNILITGSNGLIGKSLTKELLRYKNKLICIDKTIAKNDFKNMKIKKIRLDILNKKELLRKLKNFNLDLIIHLGAFLGVSDTEKNEFKCLNTNIEGTKNILELGKKLHIKRIIFASSSEVYGDGYKSIMNEKDKLIPKSSYGISKLTAEAFVKAHSIKCKINYNILRFFNIYGPNQRKNFVIPKLITNVKNNRNLKIYGTGNQVRCFCHINDAVRAIHLIIQKGKKNKIYNVGNNYEPITILSLAKKIKYLSKKKLKIEKIPFDRSDRTLKREIFYRKPDITEIIKDTDYKPRIKLNSGLLEMIEK